VNLDSLLSELISAFNLMQKKMKKAKGTHIREIQAFQKYFKTVYDPLHLSQTVHNAAKTLKEKLLEKIPTSKFPPFVTNKYLFALYLKVQFPPLPSSVLALAFRPPYPKWFVCGSWMEMKQSLIKKEAKKITPTKLDIYTFRGCLHYGLHQICITSPIEVG